MIKPKKSLGQNFLINQGVLDKIISAADISKGDIILEVGPGTGNLTKKIAEKADRIIAIEKDRRLIESLTEIFKNTSNIDIIEGDILKFPINNSKLMLHASDYKIVANIPYYITSNFLRIIFEDWPQPKLIILTVQKEIALRITAKPPHMNLLALSVQYYSNPEIISYVSRGSFRPIPKIDSAIIRLLPKHERRNENYDKQLFNLIRIGFSEKRKQLASVLSKRIRIKKEPIIETFEEIGINREARAENLDLNQWKQLKERLTI